MSLSSGDKVRVIAGSYTGWEGEVSRVEGGRHRVMVVITVFGKALAIEVRPSEIEPFPDGGTSYAQSDSPADPDAPVREPRRSGPGDKNSAVSIVEPEDEQPADANAGIAHDPEQNWLVIESGRSGSSHLPARFPPLRGPT